MESVLERWTKAASDNHDQAEARLIFITTRICLARHPDKAFENVRLIPVPMSTRPPDPAQSLERSDDVTVALLCSLELLSRDECAAYLLHDVLHADYGEIAQILGKHAATCRQLVQSAQIRLGKRATQTRTPARNTADHDFRLLRRFANALAEGDLATLKGTLAESVELDGDGRGKLHRSGDSLRGVDQVAHRFVADSLRYGSSLRIELAPENGRWVLSFLLDDQLESTLLPEFDGFRITRLHVRGPLRGTGP